ncbi:hypothetical protein HN924_00420 [Candidatus Woesearchaeota archaeon]|jgi:hypothetical protein|nr:hypothetical protein [Candidatus Woesearchaeota archaeon]MBT7062416.1 hypothetical protein [Candidatus Woesearchaeota archaeon]MBT7402950.1 hypothetical protein [Candidatus Woesearchaeota archaeon]
MNKQGFEGFFAFVFSLLILGILAISVLFFKADVELFFDVEEVTRFEGCDVTLLNVLRAEVTDVNGNSLGYDYAEAIGRNGVSSVKLNIEELVEPIFKDKTVVFKDTSCATADLSKCCSQIVPKYKPEQGELSYVEVSLVDETK